VFRIALIVLGLLTTMVYGQAQNYPTQAYRPSYQTQELCDAPKDFWARCEDLSILTLVCFSESRNQPFTDQYAATRVAFNRWYKRDGPSLYSVVFAPSAFSNIQYTRVSRSERPAWLGCYQVAFRVVDDFYRRNPLPIGLPADFDEAMNFQDPCGTHVRWRLYHLGTAGGVHHYFRELRPGEQANAWPKCPPGRKRYEEPIYDANGVKMHRSQMATRTQVRQPSYAGYARERAP
jgi:hypothetical protein